MWWLLSTSRLANPYNLIFIFQIHIDEDSQNKSSTMHVYEFLVIPKRNMPSVTDIRFHLASEHIAEPSRIKASRRNVTTTAAMGMPTITLNPWITSHRSGPVYHRVAPNPRKYDSGDILCIPTWIYWYINRAVHGTVFFQYWYFRNMISLCLVQNVIYGISTFNFHLDPPPNSTIIT